LVNIWQTWTTVWCFLTHSVILKHSISKHHSKV